MSESSVVDEIGRQGEIEFDRIANKAGLLVGKIDPDRVGKDRYVEAKLLPRDDNVPFDKRPAPLACGIQIKSVLKTTKVVTLSLSVAERLAQSVQPAFICIVRLDDEYDLIEMRLVHILGHHLEKILKRLREEFAKGTIELNSKTVSFSIKDAKVIGKKPSDLKDALSTAIGSGMDSYAQEKTKQKRTLGFKPDGSVHIEGAVVNGKIEEIVDGLLGLQPMLLSRLDISEERFGIRLPHPLQDRLGSGTARFTPEPFASCVLIIGTPDTENAIEIPCNAYFPLVSGIPIEHFKARLTSKYLDAVFTYQNISFQSAEGWDDIHRAHYLADLITYFQIMVALEKPDCPMTLRGPDRPELLGKVRLVQDHKTGQAAALLRMLQAFEKIRSEARIDDRPISLAAVYEAYTEVTKVSRIIGGSSLTSDLSFETPFVESTDKTSVGLVFISHLNVGEEKFAYALTCEMEADHQETEIKWRQISPMQFIDLQAVSDNDVEMSRYQHRMMLVSRSRLSICEVFGEPQFEEETSKLHQAG